MADMGNQTCERLGFTGGILICNHDCTFDGTECEGIGCGNGIREPGESCDISDMGGEDCTTLGFDDGHLSCNASCEFDTFNCDGEGCGNGTREGEEDCDISDLGGQTCGSQGFWGGALGCFDDCSFDATECIGPGCGNGVQEDDEECDVADTGGQTCVSIGFESGVLNCTPDCTLDSIGCLGPGCGNGIREPGELCDVRDFGGKTCETMGFDGGSLHCSEECEFDTGNCDGEGCGDGILQETEACDGDELNNQSCLDLGFTGGTLSCRSDCTLNAEECNGSGCGNSIQEDEEDCDGADLNNNNCTDIGFTGGVLNCNSECKFDALNCKGPGCGNGTVDPGEECDAHDLNNTACTSIGFLGGDLTCKDDCTFDAINCTGPGCGNGALDPGEECDLEDLGDNTCESQGFDQGGLLSCTDDCVLDLNWCNGEGCGNGIIEGEEECDRDNLDDLDCESMGFDGGELRCDYECLYNLAGCRMGEWCGDDVKNGNEQCDQSDLGDETCESLGYLSGELVCYDECRYDTHGCEVPTNCGNEAIDDGEECDGEEYDGQACKDFGFNAGDIACTDRCTFDLSDCISLEFCGNGEVDPGEGCDLTELKNQTCLSLGYQSGDLACNSICELDTEDCVPHVDCGNGRLDEIEECDGEFMNGESCESLNLGSGELACLTSCHFDTSDCQFELCTDDDYERNDTLNQSASIDLGDIPNEYDLMLCNPDGGETDWFMLEVIHRQRFSAEVRFNPDVLPLDLRLVNESSQELAVSEGAAESEGTRRLSYTPDSDEMVYLSVFPSGPGMSSYDLAVSLNADCIGDEDCNNEQICVGFQCRTGCRDDASCANGQICDEEEFICIEGCRDDDGCETREICINKSCRSGCRTDDQCPIDSYCIDLNCSTLVCEEDSFESNDRPSDATDFTERIDTSVEGLTLCGKNEEDWYSFDLEQLKVYRFDTLFATADGDIDIYLYPASDLDLWLIRSASGDNNESFTFVPDSTESYLLKVKLMPPTVYTQDYDLEVSLLGDWECYESPDCNQEGFCVDYRCADCIEHSHCDSGYICEENACVAFTCTDERPCPGDLICDSEGQCVECASDLDCEFWILGWYCEENVCKWDCQEDYLEENDTPEEVQTSGLPVIEGDLSLCDEEDDDWFKVSLEEQKIYSFEILFLDVIGDVDTYLFYGENLDSSIMSGVSSTNDESLLYITPAGKSGDYYLRIFLSEYRVIGQSYTLIVEDLGFAECLIDLDCPNFGERCATGKCVIPECEQHSDCDPGTICDDYSCVDFSCNNDSDCPDDLMCNNSRQCVGCMEYSDCPDWWGMECTNFYCTFNCEEDDHEPNNREQDATPIEIEQEMWMWLCGQHEEDWFIITLEEELTYEIKTEFLHDYGNIDVRLMNSLSSPVEYGLSTTDDEIFTYQVPVGGGGDYYIRIRLEDPDFPSQLYILTVTDLGIVECNWDDECWTEESNDPICHNYHCIEDPCFSHRDCWLNEQSFIFGNVCIEYVCTELDCAQETCVDNLVCNSENKCAECLSDVDCGNDAFCPTDENGASINLCITNCELDNNDDPNNPEEGNVYCSGDTDMDNRSVPISSGNTISNMKLCNDEDTADFYKFEMQNSQKITAEAVSPDGYPLIFFVPSCYGGLGSINSSQSQSSNGYHTVEEYIQRGSGDNTYTYYIRVQPENVPYIRMDYSINITIEPWQE